MNSQRSGQRLSLSFGFLLMGFSFAVTQSLLIREFLVAFSGNELSIGLILGNWLILEAIGSGLLGRLAGRWQAKPPSFAALQVLFALFLPLCLLAISLTRRLVGAIPGEGVGLLPIAWSSLLILFPLGLIDGAMFAFGCRSFAQLTRDTSSSIGRVYVLEALGGIAGGLVFTYLFIPFLHSLQTALILSGLNLLAAILVLAAFRRPRRGRTETARLSPAIALPAILLLADLLVLASPLAGELQRSAASQRWPGYRLLYSENSAYGNVSAIERQGQYTFLADGIPILNAPVPDLALSEEIVHLPLLFVPQPRRALVLSGGLGGVLRELYKYPLERVDYAELDPLLIEAVQQVPTTLTGSELGDPRLGLELVDGRLLVRELQAGATPYDLVIVNLPYPSTLQLNRFYTAEFFHMVRALLARDGVVVISIPGSLSYLSEELRDLNAMAYSTLREAFPHVRPIPGELTLWLASSANDLPTATVDSLVDRWQARDLGTQLVSEPHIRLRLEQRYLDWFWNSLDAEGGEARVNRDLHPRGLFYGLSYWNALFSPALARLFNAAGRLRLWHLAVALLGSTLLYLAVVRLRGRGKASVVPVAIAATGFAGMCADLVIILAFQSLYGHVYHWIGLLLTAFMGGLAAGGLLMSRRAASHAEDRRAFLWLEVALVLFWLLVPLTLSGLYGSLAQPAPVEPVQVVLFLLNAGAGFLVGAQFPVANRLWLGARGSRQGGEGALYASDLAGAFLGSILVSVLLIPVLGILQTCLLAATLKVCSLLLYALLPGSCAGATMRNPLNSTKDGQD
jgi:spermidine synthase